MINQTYRHTDHRKRFGSLLVVFTWAVGALLAQDAANKADILFTIGNKQITVAGNGDILSVTNGGSTPTPNDIVVTSYGDVPVTENRDISVWKGNYFPSVFFFPIDRHFLLRNYRNNDIMLAALDELARTPEVVANMDTIEIIGACSPVGSEEYNVKLALSRCMALRSYLRWKHLEFSESLPMKFNIIGIDRLGYKILKESKANLSEKQIWDMLQYAAIRLKMKDGSYIIPGADKPKNFFTTPSDYIAPNPVEEPYNAVRDTVYLKCDTVYVYATTTEYIYPNKPEKTSAPIYAALKTNLLYDAALLPNLSAEWYVGKNWSLVVEGNWSWWTFDRPLQNWWYHRIQVAGIEIRKWVKSSYPLHGHAVGLYTLVGNYDVRFFTHDEDTKGWLSYQSWSAGLSYAYSFPIARRFNLEFGFAAGYFGGRYYRYDYCMTHEHWAQRAMYNRNYIGPTRVGISLVWLLGAGNDEKSRNTYLTRKNKENNNYIIGLQKNKLKRFIYIVSGMIVALLGFTACEQKELFLCPPMGNIPVNVVIHWDSVPSNCLVLPKDMTVHWYPTSGSLIASDMGVYGGREWLNADKYNVMCLDFNGNTTLGFRSNGSREDFEVYNTRMMGLYNTNVPQLPGGETTVAEAYPYRFYIDRRSQTIDTENIPLGDTLTVHFYPKDVLREFTFLVYDVIGGKYMVQNGGAMSGMSGSYFPASDKLASTPSTILFSRVETITNGQTSSRWTDQDKALFAAKDPNWASADTLVGWTRDWVNGKFVTFGPLNTSDHHFRLTVETLTKASNHFHGEWGYWHGEWENTVAAQIDSAMGKNGTWEEQLAWRQRNGGYDIILYNDRRLVIPEGEGDGSANGGFTVSVGDWGDIIDVPVASSPSPSPAAKSTALRSAVNTYATIPDFVVNGIYKDTNNDLSYIFNEQYVYKPESGILWDYSPTKYWPTSGQHIDFYAYAPAGVTNLIKGLHDDDTNPKIPVIEYAMPSKDREEPPPGTGEPSILVVADNQDDLLVAVQNRTTPPTDPVVPMNFRHAFSRVTVKAKTAGDYSNAYRIKVTRVDLRYLNIRGRLKLNADDPSSGYSTGIPMEKNQLFVYDNTDVNKVTLWTLSSNPDTLGHYRFKLATRSVPIDEQYTTLLLKDDGIFVIPQPVIPNKTAVYVEYDIYTVSYTEGEQYDKSRTQLLSLPTNFAFEIGRQYELQLTLGIP